MVTSWLLLWPIVRRTCPMKFKSSSLLSRSQIPFAPAFCFLLKAFCLFSTALTYRLQGVADYTLVCACYVRLRWITKTATEEAHEEFQHKLNEKAVARMGRNQKGRKTGTVLKS
eukprot:468897-Amphidinium_carterae.1